MVKNAIVNGAVHDLCNHEHRTIMTTLMGSKVIYYIYNI